MQTKNSLPIKHLQGKNTLPIIEVYFEFNHLKQLYRQGWLNSGIPANRCESVAEHSFSVALLALFLAEAHFPTLHPLTVLRMALIHDFGEIYAGDFTPNDNISPEEKYRLEKESVIQVLSKLPNGKTYIDLWEAFEKGETPEARFIQQIDRLEMGLQAAVYEQQGLADLSGFFVSVEKALSSPELQQILEVLEDIRGKNN